MDNANLMRDALIHAKRLELPVLCHCEDTSMVANRAVNEGSVSRQLWMEGRPAIAEEIMVMRDAMLAEETGAHVHICHISTAKAVDIVRRMKKRGIALTCETCPQYFTLTEDEVLTQGSMARVNPPLRTAKDIKGIIAGLKDGTIDAIATDHAPHSAEEKARPLAKAPSGMIGLETSLAITLTELYHTGRMKLPDLIRRMTYNPASILRLPTKGRLSLGSDADITIFDPRTCKITGAIHTGQAPSTGSYNSTEQMAQYDKWVFVNCWSYSNKILVIDSDQDKVVHEIELRSIQPNSLVVDRNGKLWALTDGGYAGSEYGQTEPCLYRIDAATWRVEQEFVFEKEEYPSELCINGAGDVLYFINDGICKMSVTAAHAPVRPLIPNERRHQIYGLAVDPTSGEIYVGDAIDFEQPGVVYRYRDTGQSAELVDSFGVGMLPSAFAFK